MAIDLANFHVQDIIVHDVPTNDGRPPEQVITLSDAAMPDVDNSRRNFFRERINGSLTRAYIVQPDPEQPSRLPELVADLIGDPTRLVPASQEMARALYSAQNKVNNPGLLTVITGNAGPDPCVCVLKLQRQRGLRLEQIVTPGGQATFSSTIFDDLTLNDDTKVFKASAFLWSPDGLDGLVSDDQRARGRGREVADFFLSRFLGCKFKTDPKLATKEFFEASRTYIRTVEDPSLKLTYTAALNAYLLSPSPTVVPTDFVEQFLETRDQQPFLDHLTSRGIPEAAIDKQTELIDANLRRITVATHRGLRIVGSAALLDELVRIEPADGAQPARIVIQDAIEELR